MGELFANFEDFDLPAARKIAKEEGITIGQAKQLTHNIENLMNNFHICLASACEGVGSSEEEYRNAKALLAENSVSEKGDSHETGKHNESDF